MSDELFSDIAGIDALLRRAGRAFTYPPTPGIATAVEARLREIQREAPRERRPGLMPGWLSRPAMRVVIAAITVALLTTAVALAVPISRSAIADFFGLGHVRVSVGPTGGPTPPVLSPQSFARPSNLDEAQRLVDFTLRLPTQDGRRLLPDAVYIEGEASSLPVVIFVFESQGYDLYQTKAGFFGKGGPDPSLIHQISFAGHPALWIDQGGHIATFLDAQGRLVVASPRTVGRATLLWEEDGMTYRLETALTQEQAIQVAASLR